MAKISYNFFQAGSRSTILSRFFFMLVFKTILQLTERYKLLKLAYFFGCFLLRWLKTFVVLQSDVQTLSFLQITVAVSVLVNAATLPNKKGEGLNPRHYLLLAIIGLVVYLYREGM